MEYEKEAKDILSALKFTTEDWEELEYLFEVLGDKDLLNERGEKMAEVIYDEAYL